MFNTCWLCFLFCNIPVLYLLPIFPLGYYWYVVHYIFFKFYFIFGFTGSLLPCVGFSLVAASGGYSLLWCAGFSLWWPLLLQSTGSRAQAQQLWLTSLVALWHVGPSPTRARTRVPCIGRRILNHCTTREALSAYFWYSTVYYLSMLHKTFRQFVISLFDNFKVFSDEHKVLILT